MTNSVNRSLVATALAGTSLIAISIATAPAYAQTAQSAAAPVVEEVVVTGSRIRTTDTTTPAPVAIINSQTFEDRGFVQAGQALNQMTANTPVFPSAGGGATRSATPGQQAPNLLGLGAGRTLSLMNGQRMPTTSSGLGGAQTDSNIFPMGLIDRIDIIPGGGASIYGSGAIGGVVNYVVKDHFQGVTVDTQGGISTYGDYPQWSLRVTAGTDFLGGKGNVAADLEYSHTGYLNALDRPVPNLAQRGVPNPAFGTGPGQSTSVPQQIYTQGQLKVYSATPGGIVYRVPTLSSDMRNQMLNVNGSLVQFAPGGGLVNFNPGTIYTTSVGVATGGDGYPRAGYDGLALGVDRYIGNGIAHYELSDHMKLSTELMYARTNAYAPNQQLWQVDYDPSLIGAVPFYSGNPYLPAATKASLLTAFPTWAAAGPSNGVCSTATPCTGGTAPLWLGVAPTDLLPDYGNFTATKTYRGRVALSGDFDIGSKNFYYEVSLSHAETHQNFTSWSVITQNFLNALNTVSTNGQPACAVGGSCVPINIFGGGQVTRAAQQYVSAQSGVIATGGGAVGPFVNRMDDMIASLGGDIVELPAGAAKFNVAYERRIEGARFTPKDADQQGIVYLGTKTLPTSGQFHTGEYSAEVLIPILGKGYNLPFVQSLELNASDRLVEHSIAGTENVWGAGLKWGVVDGVTFRGSLSRNFNSPTLSQLLAPQSVALSVVSDPCQPTNINSGNNPAARAANCLAAFTANPGYGLDTLAGQPNTPANRLKTFNSLANNLSTARVTSGGNPTLVSETSHTQTFGVILQPTFAPGLTVSADRIIVGMTNQLSQFTAATFLTNCFDAPTTVYPSALCSTVVRDASGQISTARSQPFNAGYVRIGTELYNIDYRFPLNAVFGGSDIGDLNLTLQASHNTGNWSVTALSVTENDGTTANPEWVASFNTAYSIGAWRFTARMSYYPAQPPALTSTVVNTVNGYTPVSDNARFDLSAQYSIGEHYTVRAGISNVTNTGPNMLPLYGGDSIGRQFFMGVKAKF